MMSSYLNKPTINTGDVLLFAGYSTNSFLVKFFTSSKYSHVGIAIRLNKKGEVTTDEDGRLCVLDVNPKERRDLITRGSAKGIALVDYEDLKIEYVDIDVRHLDRSYHTKNFCHKVQRFINQHRNIKYCNSLSSILSVWLGCPISGIKRDKEDMICSELAAYFYLDVCGVSPTIDKPASLYRPSDFIYRYSKIFSSREYNIHTCYLDAHTVLLLPLILCVIIILSLFHILPRKRR